jgi:putative addiction module component (TIGR02574 family)
MTKEQFEALLAKVRSWPEDDQAELLEFALWIESRRAGPQGLSENERRANDSTLTPLTDAQKAELERRVSEHDADPSTALEWSAVRAELWSQVKAK